MKKNDERNIERIWHVEKKIGYLLSLVGDLNNNNNSLMQINILKKFILDKL